MTLVLNEEQLMLKDSAAGFLAQKASVSHLRALRDSNSSSGFDPAVWRAMVDMGWAGIAIPEAFGGLGYGYTGLGLVLEQIGRHLSSSPLEATVLVAATLINELGTEAQKELWLSAIAAGNCQMTLALQEGKHHAPERTALMAVPKGAGYRLNGSKQFVLDASTAQYFLVVARSAGEVAEGDALSVFIVPADTKGLRIEARSMVDSRAAGVLHLDAVQLGVEALLGEAGQARQALERSLDIANIGLAAQLLGLSLEAFERSLTYLKERQQFGQLIGSFQALQHRAAKMFAELELARSIVLQALQAIDQGGDGLSLLASAAKAKLCEVAELVSNEAVQMHGGIGMTDEHDIGLFLKRARVLQHSFGDYNYHLDRFAQLKGY